MPDSPLLVEASSTSQAQRAPRTISTAEAALHLMKGNLGPGVLALPAQFAIVGPKWGVGILLVVAVQGVYCMWLLSVTQKRASECVAADRAQLVAGTVFLTFDDLGQLAFGCWGRILVKACVLAMQLGICSVFLSLVSENLSTALEDVGIYLTNRYQSIALAFAPCALLSLLPDLSSLWPLSAFGTFAMLFALASAVIAATIQLISRDLPETFATVQPPSTPCSEAAWSVPTAFQLSSAVSSTFYALEGISIVLPVGSALAPTKRNSYPSTLLCALIFVVLVFGVTATVTAIGFPGVDDDSITAYLARTFKHGDSVGAYFSVVNLVVTVAVRGVGILFSSAFAL